MRWLNKSVAIINITLQLLDVYKKTESHYPSNFEFVLSKFRINPIKSILNQYKKIKKKKKLHLAITQPVALQIPTKPQISFEIFKIMACLDCKESGDGGGGE